MASIILFLCFSIGKPNYTIMGINACTAEKVKQDIIFCLYSLQKPFLYLKQAILNWIESVSQNEIAFIENSFNECCDGHFNPFMTSRLYIGYFFGRYFTIWAIQALINTAPKTDIFLTKARLTFNLRMASISLL